MGNLTLKGFQICYLNSKQPPSMERYRARDKERVGVVAKDPNKTHVRKHVWLKLRERSHSLMIRRTSSEIMFKKWDIRVLRTSIVNV